MIEKSRNSLTSDKEIYKFNKTMKIKETRFVNTKSTTLGHINAKINSKKFIIGFGER